MSKPSSLSVTNGITRDAGDRAPLEHHARPGDLEARVLHVDLAAAPDLACCATAASVGSNGSSGSIRSPRITHILPGCCVHFSTARSESTPLLGENALQARRIVSAVRNGLVGRRMLKQS